MNLVDEQKGFDKRKDKTTNEKRNEETAQLQDDKMDF